MQKKEINHTCIITNWNFLSFFFHITLRLGKDQKYVSKRGRGGLVVGNTGFYQIQIVVKTVSGIRPENCVKIV